MNHDPLPNQEPQQHLSDNVPLPGHAENAFAFLELTDASGENETLLGALASLEKMLNANCAAGKLIQIE